MRLRSRGPQSNWILIILQVQSIFTLTYSEVRSRIIAQPPIYIFNLSLFNNENPSVWKSAHLNIVCFRQGFWKVVLRILWNVKLLTWFADIKEDPSWLNLNIASWSSWWRAKAGSSEGQISQIPGGNLGSPPNSLPHPEKASQWRIWGCHHGKTVCLRSAVPRLRVHSLVILTLISLII